MRKKIISGFLALAMVFTSVPTSVIALGTGDSNVNRQNINNGLFDDLFGSNDDGSTPSTNSNNSNSNSGLFDDLFASDSNSNSNNSSSSSSNSNSGLFDDLFTENNNSNNNNSNNNNSSNSNSGLFDDLFAGDNNSNDNSSDSNSNSDLFDDLFNNDNNSNDNSTDTDSNSGLFDDLFTGNNTPNDSVEDEDDSSDLFDDVTSDNDDVLLEETPEEELPEENIEQDSTLDLFNEMFANNDSNANNSNNADNEVSTLDEDIVTTESNEDKSIVIKIDTTYLGDAKLKGVNLPSNVTANVIDSSNTSSVSNIVEEEKGSIFSNFFKKLNIFAPMSITYANTELIIQNAIDNMRVNLINNTVGYVGEENGPASLADVDDIGDLQFSFEYPESGEFEYDPKAVGISNFKPGTLPIFSTDDFDRDLGDVEFTGWSFDPAIKFTQSNELGVATIQSVTNLTLISLSGDSKIEIQPSTVITAIFADPTQTVSASGSFVYKGTGTPTVTASIYKVADSSFVKSVEVTTADTYKFDDLELDTNYEIKFTGDAIEATSKTFYTTGSGTEISLGTVEINEKTTTYTVQYADLNSAGNELVFKSATYTQGATVSISGLSNELINYLTNKNEKFKEWVVYKNVNDGTPTDSDKIPVSSSLNTIGGFTFVMPEFDIYVLFDTEAIQGGYTVNFYDSYSGTNISSQSNLNIGDKVSVPLNPNSRPGYSFVGWYTTATGSTAWNFETLLAANNFNANKEMTLYAKWLGNEVNVVIDYDGSSGNSGQIKGADGTTGVARVGESFNVDAGSKSGHMFDYWWWTTEFEQYNHDMKDYGVTNNGISKISFTIPPLNEGDTLYIDAEWRTLSASIVVANIVDSEDNGDSCYVTLTSSKYGSFDGEYVTSSGGSQEGYYVELEDAGPGFYTVEVSTTSGQEMIDVIYIEDDNYNYKTINMLDVGKIVSVSNTAGSNIVPNISSNNLSEMFTSSELSSSDDVSIQMQVKSVPSTSIDAQNILANLSDNHSIGMFLDISLFKTIGSTKYSDVQPPNSKGLNVTIQLTDDFLDHKSYAVYTVHDGLASSLSSANVKYDSDTNSISFYTTQLSVFGIAVSGSTTGTSTVSTFIPTDPGYVIPLFQNVVVGQWLEGLAKYQLIHPEPDKWEFAGWYHGGTLAPLELAEYDPVLIVTQAMLDNGIYPRFREINPDGTPVPSTGSNSNSSINIVTLANLF